VDQDPCGKWRGYIPRAPGPSAVSGRSDNLLIFDRFLTETARQRRPQVYSRTRSSVVTPSSSSWVLKWADVRARAAKIRVHSRTLPERILLNPSDCHSSMHSHWHTVSAEEGFGDRKRFFVIYGFQCGFPGMLVSVKPRNLRAAAQNFHRMLCHIFYCALAGEFWALSFLNPQVLTWAGLGWCRRSWSDLVVTGEPLAA
jgi:hypothetical protein